MRANQPSPAIRGQKLATSELTATVAWEPVPGFRSHGQPEIAPALAALGHQEPAMDRPGDRAAARPDLVLRRMEAKQHEGAPQHRHLA